MLNKCITVVLATYNGAKYLREQLDSIFECEYFDELVSKVIISDDGSTDDTSKILLEYKSKYNNVHLSKNKSKGVKANFINGIMDVESEYIVLCDQDDIWERNKLITLYNEIIKIENERKLCGLVFSDSTMVDSELNIINNSFFDFNKLIIKDRLNTKAILLKNVCQGCVMIFNKKIVDDLFNTNHEYWVMHDWAIMINGVSNYAVGYIEEPLIKYRIHSNNAIGEKKTNILRKIINISNEIRKYSNYIDSVFQQASEMKKSSIINKDFELSFSDWFCYENSNLRKLASVFFYKKITENIKRFNIIN